MDDFETHPAGAAARIEQLESELTRAKAYNNLWSKNSRETFEAMASMRDAINEFAPMPSLESDLLQGPESSVFFAVVAEAVVSALTRANAATAAAYEVAARACSGIIKDYYCMKDDGKTYHPLWVQKVAKGMVSIARQDIRSLATPDQTAALDKLIAEAEARVWEKAAEIAHDYTPEKHSGATLASHVTGRSIEAAILAASKKGGV